MYLRSPRFFAAHYPGARFFEPPSQNLQPVKEEDAPAERDVSPAVAPAPKPAPKPLPVKSRPAALQKPKEEPEEESQRTQMHKEFEENGVAFFKGEPPAD